MARRGRWPADCGSRVGRAPLDFGPHPRRVLAGGVASYVPTAAMLARTAALGAGFDPALRYGEDVDLVWRLQDAGWRVRYEPAVEVGHDEPARWRSLLERRFRYGTSAGPLALRHGGRLAPVVLRPWPTAATALVLARRPVAATAVTAVAAARLGRTLRRTGVPARHGRAWATTAVVDTLDGIARSATMLAAPAAAAAVARGGRGGRSLGALLVASSVRSWWRSERTLDPVRWALAATADDVAYGAGVWTGALKVRAPRALMPSVRSTGK